MKKRICIVTSSFPSAEDPLPGSMIPYYAEEFRRRGWEVSVFLPFRSARILRPAGITIRQFGEPRALKTSFAMLRIFDPVQLLRAWKMVAGGGPELAEFCLKNRIDYCLACWAIPAGFWAMKAAKKTGVPYSVWSLGSDIHTWAKYPVIRSVIRGVLRRADKLFADGIGLAKEMTRISGKPAEYMPSTTGFPAGKAPASVNVDRKKYNFLFLGRWEKVKGIDVLFRAFPLFFRDSTAEFHLLGSGSLSAKLSASLKGAAWRGHVRIHGVVPRSSLKAYMDACDCLVIPSRKESIPYVFSEGLKSGMALLTTDAGDMADLLSRHRAGLSVRRGDPAALAAGLARMAAAGKDPVAFRKARKDLLKVFDIRSSVAHFLARISI